MANAISFTATGRVHLHITAQETGEGGVTGLTAIVADTGQGMVDLMQAPTGFPSLHEVEELVLPQAEKGGQNILVVDDMHSNRDILRLILETQGHRCGEAADGFAALAALERQSFDLIVLDIHMMPMDGVETLRRLRASRKPYANVPVIALTADNAASTNSACMEAGADLFLSKPVRRDELLRAIDYLNQTEGARILSQ